MKINRELIKERAREIGENLVKIRRYAALSDAEFFADERNLYTVLHLLLVTIEATSRICAHLLARMAKKTPASFAECMEGMRELGIVDAALATRLVQMARFRNLLVHQYWQVDPTRVLAYARENLGDFEAYLAAVDQYLQNMMHDLDSGRASTC
jgi:uncharacterized protein YutE (UPF0331/DUF86 family)